MNSREAIPSQSIHSVAQSNNAAHQKIPKAKISTQAIPFTGNINHWATVIKAADSKKFTDNNNNARNSQPRFSQHDGAAVTKIPSGILQEHSHHLRHNVPKRLQFETLKERQTRQIMKMEQKKEYVNLNDHVRRDDDDLSHYVRDMCTMVRDSKYFKIFELIVILTAFVELGVEDMAKKNQQKPRYK